MSNLNWRSLLSSNALIQVPWIKVAIGNYIFGVGEHKKILGSNGTTTTFTTYPNFIKSLSVSKINGQINRYNLTIVYPIKTTDDPNFFEKVFSSVSDTRKIIFSYGDFATPSFAYKNEEAMITRITQQFNLAASSIQYNVEAVSVAELAVSGSYTFPAPLAAVKPSKLIKEIFKNPIYGLSGLFTGMLSKDLEYFIAGDDAPVLLETKINTSVLDYLNYLVSCMIPAGSTNADDILNDIYVLTIHDETYFDEVYGDVEITGPYFKVERTSYRAEKSDAYTIDVGYNTSTIVLNFSIEKNENYSILYDYQSQLHSGQYVERIADNGKYEKVYAPVNTTKGKLKTEPNDRVWWTKVTKFPINASITLQGLLRPAMLMSYVRLNVIFPGGHKHISSGLYLVTKQTDSISQAGYRTTLGLTRISGDNDMLTTDEDNRLSNIKYNSFNEKPYLDPNKYFTKL